MSTKLLGTVLLAATVLTGGILLQGPLTPSFALSPSERITPLPPVSLLPEDAWGDGQSSGPSVQGDAARLAGLMRQAEAIVTGTVIGEAHALDGRAAVTTVEVRDWLKGGASRYIRIAQRVGEGGDLLRSGESYLLLLGSVPGNTADMYRICGTKGEGRFGERDGAWSNDDPLLTQALQSWSEQQPAALAAKLAP